MLPVIDLCEYVQGLRAELLENVHRNPVIYSGPANMTGCEVIRNLVLLFVIVSLVGEVNP